MVERTRLCPICHKPVPKSAADAGVLPFCSKQCADIDLSRWLNGTYAIPAVEMDGDATAGKDKEADEEPEGTIPDRPARH